MLTVFLSMLQAVESASQQPAFVRPAAQVGRGRGHGRNERWQGPVLVLPLFIAPGRHLWVWGGLLLG